MPLTIMKLLFVTLALALLVVVVLIVRQVLRKRDGQPAAPRPRKAAPAPKPRGRAREKADPEPEPSPPSPRRRQLHSFAESERAATVELEPSIPFPEAPADEPAPLAEQELSTAATPDPTSFDAEVLARLEAAFEGLQAGEFSLQAYRELLLAEKAAIERRIALLESGGDGPELEAALTARESVQWCLDWAAQQDDATLQ